MSLAGVLLWELLSSYRHRSRLRSAGTLPPRRPRFGLARWVWFPRVTHLARLLALRDGHTLTESAWRAALEAAGRHGSVRAAIAELRGRHPDTPAGPDGDETTAQTRGESTASGTGETSDETAQETAETTPAAASDQTSAANRNETSAETSRADRVETAAATSREPLPASAPAAYVQTAAGSLRRRRNGHQAPQPAGEHAAALDGRRRKPGDWHASRRPGGIKAKMVRYVQRQRRAGKTVTGAELDRRFGTRNYGSRILRELDAQRHSPDQ
jgi:hypothetical protein